jgi:hypothetical protein
MVKDFIFGDVRYVNALKRLVIYHCVAAKDLATARRTMAQSRSTSLLSIVPERNLVFS